MNKPKSITQLSKEQLEDMCLNLMHVDNEKAKIIEQLETNRDEAIEYVKKYNIGMPYERFVEKEKVLKILERGKDETK